MWAQLAKILTRPEDLKRKSIFSAVFRRILKEGRITSAQLVADARIPERTAQRYLRELVKRGVIEARRDSETLSWYYTWSAEFKYIITKARRHIVDGRPLEE